jgi:hypothetical protein
MLKLHGSLQVFLSAYCALLKLTVYFSFPAVPFSSGQIEIDPRTTPRLIMVSDT